MPCGWELRSSAGRTRTVLDRLLASRPVTGRQAGYRPSPGRLTPVHRAKLDR
jgi:hypothetical protein